MFLHLMPWDQKWVERIQGLFEAAAAGQHLYVLIGSPSGNAVLPRGAVPLRGEDHIREIIGGQPAWDGIVVHGVLFSTVERLLSAIPKTIPIACYVWGREVYEHLPILNRRLLQRETSRIVNRLRGPSLRRYIPRWIPLLSAGRLRMMQRVSSRYDYNVGTFPEEYELFVSSGVFQNTRYLWGAYGSLEDFVDVDQVVAEGQDIQIGNSGNATNNHADAFTFVGQMNRSPRRIVVPLSYYTDRRYCEAVATEGRARFGDAFEPLFDFMPLAEYQRRVDSCGLVVMNQLRQQAWGNVLLALWRGARVYMNGTPIYGALTRLGFDVSLMRDVSSRGAGLQPCTHEQAQRNRELLAVFLDRDKLLRATADLLQKLRDTARERRS
jgi:dTDP-N-acetylfucosamine:lipid II N-acetylfucosaminyltransferase